MQNLLNFPAFLLIKLLSLFDRHFHCYSNIQRLHCACALYKLAYGHPFDLLVHDCCGHRKNANYFSLTHTRSAGKAADGSCAYTICHHCRLSYCSYTLAHTQCVLALCSALPALPSLPSLPVVVVAVDAVCWLAACLFRLSDTDTFAALTQRCVCCVYYLMVSLFTRSFGWFASASAALCVCEWVCVSASASAAAAAASRFGLLCLLWLCVALPLLAWYSCFSWISVQFSIDDARSTFCSAFTVFTVFSSVRGWFLDRAGPRVK